MDIKSFLPVGSVVLLEGAEKKIVIIGVMPVKHMNSGEEVAYDYMGVPYPEGFIGSESALLFNHESIKDTVFLGYSNEEREIFVEAIQKIMDKASHVLSGEVQVR